VEIHPETGRPETEQERVDRNLTELLNELRVALPGVQVLFAFLLVVPFNNRFAHVTGFQKNVYFVTLLCAAAASVCLIAPTIQHRIEFRRQDKEHLVRVANKLAIAGLTFLAVAMTGAILLVTDVLFSQLTATISAAFVALGFAVLWYAIPLQRLRQRGRGD
jgi:uncharacterized protein involved in cysteine biosynthesis